MARCVCPGAIDLLVEHDGPSDILSVSQDSRLVAMGNFTFAILVKEHRSSVACMKECYFCKEVLRRSGVKV